MPPRRRKPPVPPLEGAVAAAVKDLGRRLRGADGSWEAQLALRMAREVEAPGNSLTSRTMAARCLFDAMSRLAAAAPEAVAVDRIDEIAEQRAKRRAG